MSNCRRYKELIEDFLAEEISIENRADLDAHCAECPECSDLLETHKNLLALGEEIPVPERHELREMREAVLAATALEPTTESPAKPRTGFLIDLGRLWREHPLPTGLATAAVLIGMVFLGRWNPQDRPREDRWLLPATGQPTARHANFEADLNADLNGDSTDPLDTPYSYANVTVRPREQGQLALSFDVSRHVDVQVPQDSPLAREVLLHAILDPSSMGSRLKAMEISPQLHDGRLKEALIATMLNDADPTVRLSALAVLVRYPYDQKSQDALLQALGQDQDVQMRLTVLEELAKQNVGMEALREAIGETDSNGTMAILREASVSF